MIKVEIQGHGKKTESNFPALYQLKSTGGIVLFTSEHEGMFIGDCSKHTPLHFSAVWLSCTNSTLWEKFDGTITLSNEE